MTMWTEQLGANRKAAMHKLPVTWAEAARIPDAWPSNWGKTPGTFAADEYLHER